VTTPAPSPSRRWSAPLVLLAMCGAFAAGWIGAGRRPAALPPVDFTGEIEVRTALGTTNRYRPHSVHVDDRPVFVSPEPIRGPVTVVTLDGGRVKIAATAVEVEPQQ
jgi:hypothetical protein